jgi:hypothetical protein
MNRQRQHVYVIPEDDADRQIANGFVNHHRVDGRRIQVMPAAGGWSPVLDTFKKEYISLLQGSAFAHVVLLIDFDGKFDTRFPQFSDAIPVDIRDRVFVVGASRRPEDLRISLGISFEKIGETLADECGSGTLEFWNDPQLAHNDVERNRMDGKLRSFLFS